MPAPQKICTVCGTDVASKKRTKDQQGNYFCEPCFSDRLKAVRASAGQVQTANAPGSASAGAAAVAAPPADDLLDLAPVREHAPKETAMAACATCKKLLPERQVRNVDGEFICNGCFAKRHQPAAGRKPPMAKAAAVEEERGSDEMRYSDTLMGGGLISLGTLAATFFLFFGLNTFWHDKHDTGTAVHLIYSGFQTVYIGVRAVGLIFSMIVASRLLGGISFGYIGAALYKSLIFFTGLTTLEFFMDRSESFAMIGFGFKFVLIGAAFMLLFKIDAFEAFLLSVVNTALSWGLAIALAIILIMATRHSGGSDYDDEGPPDEAGIVAPDKVVPKADTPAQETAPTAQPQKDQVPAGEVGG